MRPGNTAGALAGLAAYGHAGSVGPLEWGTHVAVLNSQDSVTPPADSAPMPAWNRGHRRAAPARMGGASLPLQNHLSVGDWVT